MAMLISSALFALVAAHLLADFRAIAGLMLFWLLAIGFAYYYSWARKAFDLYLYDKTSPIETSRGDCHEWSEIQEVRSYGRTVDLLIGTAWVKLVFAEASQQEEFLKECGKRKIHISRYDQHPGCEPLNWSTWWRPNLIFLVAIGFFSYAALGGIIPAELTKQAMFGIPILWGVFLIYTLLKLDGSIGTPAQVNKLR